MYADLIDRFGRNCATRLAAGQTLRAEEARAFLVLLEARELSGRPLLGAMAGPDPSLDTVNGRCGVRP